MPNHTFDNLALHFGVHQGQEYGHLAQHNFHRKYACCTDVPWKLKLKSHKMKFDELEYIAENLKKKFPEIVIAPSKVDHNNNNIWYEGIFIATLKSNGNKSSVKMSGWFTEIYDCRYAEAKIANTIKELK